jgi:hypothetical protein
MALYHLWQLLHYKSDVKIILWKIGVEIIYKTKGIFTGEWGCPDSNLWLSDCWLCVISQDHRGLCCALNNRHSSVINKTFPSVLSSIFQYGIILHVHFTSFKKSFIFTVFKESLKCCNHMHSQGYSHCMKQKKTAGNGTQFWTTFLTHM